MKETTKILLYSFLGGTIISFGSYLLVLLGILDPYLNLEQVFANFELDYAYEFSTFGEIFKLWSVIAMLPISGKNLFAPALSLESLLPLLLFFMASLVLGYLLKIPNGLSASLIIC
jgi:hypothetical protein